MEQPKIEMIGLLDIKGMEQIRRVYHPAGIAPTLTTCGGGAKTSESIRFRQIQS